MATRRDAREALLRLLYLAESREMSVDEALEEMQTFDRRADIAHDGDDQKQLLLFGTGIGEEQLPYVRELSKRIEEHRGMLNDRIVPHLRNWRIERIARIDRLILWISLAEMEWMLDIPVAVSINEAVELAKSYSSGKSASFINGVLDAVARKHSDDSDDTT